MSVDSAYHLGGNDYASQEFVDHFSFADLDSAHDVYPTHTRHGGPAVRHLVLDPGSPAQFRPDTVGLRLHDLIIITDTGIQTATAIRVVELPAYGRGRAVLRCACIEGLDTGSLKLVSVATDEISASSSTGVSFPARGLLKVVSAGWYREANVPGAIGQMDERQWQEFTLASKVNTVFMPWSR